MVSGLGIELGCRLPSPAMGARIDPGSVLLQCHRNVASYGGGGQEARDHYPTGNVSGLACDIITRFRSEADHNMLRVWGVVVK